MTMWEGRVYCCSGKINSDADREERICLPTSSDPSAEAPVFCTLGAPTEHVENCQTVRKKMLGKSGENTCPRNAPTFVQGTRGSPTANGRCCASLPNEALTDCMDPSPFNCDVEAAGTNWFRKPQSCQFRREQERAVCPSGYGRATMTVHDDMTVFGCSNGSSICYATSTLKRLQEMGVDTAGMQACAAR